VAFKGLTHANTILICLVLSWKGVKKRDPHPFGRQLLGHSEQWGLRDTPEGDAGQRSSVASTATCLFSEGPRKKERGKETGGGSPESKEIGEKNRIGKTRDLCKKIRDSKGTFHAKMGSIKDRNGMDLTEAEDIKKRWQKYTEELYKKRSSQPR